MLSTITPLFWLAKWTSRCFVWNLTPLTMQPVYFWTRRSGPYAKENNSLDICFKPWSCNNVTYQLSLHPFFLVSKIGEKKRVETAWKEHRERRRKRSKVHSFCEGAERGRGKRKKGKVLALQFALFLFYFFLFCESDINSCSFIESLL